MFDFQLTQNDIENNAVFFYRKNELFFRFDDVTNNHVFEFRRFCISQSLIDEILNLYYDLVNDYSNFDKYYKRVMSFYFIRELIKQLRDYFRHCLNCQIHQIRKHKFYDFLQFILISPIFFHIFIVDFILILFKSRDELNIIMFIICKFIKRVICIFDKII